MRHLSWLSVICFRGATAGLIFAVFMGATYPPLYESVMPHDHLFLGGAPPPNWEAHHHDDPLATLLGSPPASVLTVARSEPANLDILEIAPGQTGKVISIYAAPPTLVLSLLTLAMLAPVLAGPPSLQFLGSVRAAIAGLAAAEPGAPHPPPPR